MTSFDRHPSIPARRSQTRPPRPGTLPADELRRLCLEAGADDVGFVPIDRPDIASERAGVLQVFPSGQGSHQRGLPHEPGAVRHLVRHRLKANPDGIAGTTTKALKSSARFRETHTKDIGNAPCAIREPDLGEILHGPNGKDQRLATKGLPMQPDFIASPLHRPVLRLLTRPRRSVALLTPL